MRGESRVAKRRASLITLVPVVHVSARGTQVRASDRVLKGRERVVRVAKERTYKYDLPGRRVSSLSVEALKRVAKEAVRAVINAGHSLDEVVVLVDVGVMSSAMSVSFSLGKHTSFPCEVHVSIYPCSE